MNNISESEVLKIPICNTDKFAIVDLEMGQAVNWFKWYTTNDGHVFACINSKTTMIHRLILHVSSRNKQVVDHINGNPLDNRKSNLRLCTQKQNLRNQGPRKKKIVPYMGVSYMKACGKYMSSVYIDGKRKYLGLYVCPKEAAIVRDKASLELFGEYTRLNFPAEVTNG